MNAIFDNDGCGYDRLQTAIKQMYHEHIRERCRLCTRLICPICPSSINQPAIKRGTLIGDPAYPRLPWIIAITLAGVEDACILTATKMRHYSSTHYAALGVPQNQRSCFYLHMGHSKQINEMIYQTQLAEAEVTVVEECLQPIDEGTLT